MKKLMLLFFFALVFLTAVPVQAQTQNQQETLKQYVAELQNTPGNDELREKIINLVLEMKVKPVIPKEAVMHKGAWQYAFKEAKTEMDFANAAKEYEKVLLLAPWSAEDYFNCGTTYEKANKITEAIRQFNFYLLAAPGSKDANDVLLHIGELEYREKKESEMKVQIYEAQKKEELRKQRINIIIGKFKSLTEGVRYYKLSSSAVKPIEEDIGDGGTRTNYVGVNEEEFYSEGVWYPWAKGSLFGFFSFQEEGRILFYLNRTGSTAGFPDFVGTPVIIENDWEPYSLNIMKYSSGIGPPICGVYWALEHLIWEVPDLKGGIEEPLHWDGKTMEKRVWARYNFDYAKFYVSYDRPLNDALYSSKERYHYTAYWPY